MRTALGAATQSPATTNFNHLRSIPRAWLIRRTRHDPKLKSVRAQDRIKWWNIVPGDQIRLRGDREGTIHEVLSINRLSNRVFLKNTTVRSQHFSVLYADPLLIAFWKGGRERSPPDEKLPLFQVSTLRWRTHVALQKERRLSQNTTVSKLLSCCFMND